MSTNVSCYQTRCWRQRYSPFSNTGHSCTSALCVQHSSAAAVQRFRESTAAWMWVARQQDWRNQPAIGWTRGKAVIQHLSENLQFSCLRVSPGGAEALVRWGGKIKYCLTAYLLSNISAKNYQNQLLYVKVTASQSSVVFWDTSVAHWDVGEDTRIFRSLGAVSVPCLLTCQLWICYLLIYEALLMVSATDYWCHSRFTCSAMPTTFKTGK